MNNSENIGKRIRYYRKRANLTQEKLGFETLLAQKHISDLERGLKNPSATTLCKIADALGVTVSQLCQADDENNDVSKYIDRISIIMEKVPPEKREDFVESIAQFAKLTCNMTDKV